MPARSIESFIDPRSSTNIARFAVMSSRVRTGRAGMRAASSGSYAYAIGGSCHPHDTRWHNELSRPDVARSLRSRRGMPEGAVAREHLHRQHQAAEDEVRG